MKKLYSSNIASSNIKIGIRTLINGSLVIPVIADNYEDCNDCGLKKDCANLHLCCYLDGLPIKFKTID